MSEDQNRGLRDFTEYDSMTTEELERILRSDAETPVGEDSDEELLFYVMGVLADRRNNTEATGKTALEAYESLKQHYLPAEEEIDSAPAVKERKRRRPIRWMRSLAAAAVLVIVFGSMTVNAMGFNIWETVVTWAQETFHFGDGDRSELGAPTPSDSIEYSSLQDVLFAADGADNVIPTWIPDGYELHSIDIAENPLQKNYIAIYQKEDAVLKITVRSYLDNSPERIEQSDGLIDIYDIDGISYYIFQDNSQVRVAWINGSYECYISGELTMDQLRMMIDSIGKGSTNAN